MTGGLFCCRLVHISTSLSLLITILSWRAVTCVDTWLGLVSQSVLTITARVLLAWGRGSRRSWCGTHQQRWVEMASMAFWEKNSLALTVTGGFTQCPGPAATPRLQSTVETPGFGGYCHHNHLRGLLSESQTPAMTQSPGAVSHHQPLGGGPL